MKLIVSAETKEQIKAYQQYADEIVVGLKGLACSALSGMTIDEIIDLEPCSVFMNGLFFPEQLAYVEDCMKKLKDWGVISLYFADPSLVLIARKLDMVDCLIYRPESLVTSSYDMQFWDELGLKAISISPLLTKEECEILLKTTKHNELTIHGRLMMSFSKRHLLQSYQQQIQKDLNLYKNRHLTLQETKREGKMPVFEDETGTYIYTDFVLESFMYINDFEKAGLTRGFVDTTFLSKEAVVDALKLYREVNQSNAEMIRQNYRETYQELDLSSGYYEQKTIK